MANETESTVEERLEHPPREAETREPPVTLWGRLRNIGPGIVVSGCIIGSGELIVTTTMGARHGYTFLWAVIICCVIKYFIQIELGRYCIVNNFTTIQALNRVPGPKWRDTSWIVYVFFAAVIMLIAALSGILASVAGILLVNFPGIGSFGWHLIIAIVVGLILFWGFYNVIESLVAALVASFSIVVVISTFLIQGTPYQFGLGDVVQGLTFHIPAGGGAIALGLMGSTGATAFEMFFYPYWIQEKGYGRHVGKKPNENLEDYYRRAAGWINVMRTDALICTGLAVIITIAYYLMGASILNRLEVSPAGLDVVKDLSNIFTATYGRWAYWFFMFGGFCTLFSTLVVFGGSWGRMWTDLMSSMGFIDWEEQKVRFRWVRIWQNLFLISCLTFAMGIPKPVTMIIFGASFNGLMIPFFALSMMILALRVDKAVRCNTFSYTMLTITSLIAVAYIYAVMKNLIEKLLAG
jgi:Mn2+/Fe2+ NRAMP family transporter